MSRKGHMAVILSNGHFSPFRRGSIVKKIAEWIKNRLREKTLKRVRLVVAGDSRILVVSDGDLIECSCPERGLRYIRDVEAFEDAYQYLKARIGVEDMVLNAGNHELGFTDTTLAHDSQGGISQRSVENFLSLAGRKILWHSIETEKRLILLVPYLLPQEKPVENDKLDLTSLKEGMLEWLQQKLENAAKPVILMAHDPESLANESFFALVKRFERKIEHIIFGHYHSWLTLWLSRFLWQKKGAGYFIFRFTLRPIVRLGATVLKGREGVIRADKHFGSGGTAEKIFHAVDSLGATLVPSPVGMFFVGRGFVTINLDTGKLEVYK